MASISAAQSRAIDNGAFDNIGSARNLFSSIRPDDIAADIAGKLVLRMQDNLNKSKTNASGKLSSSIAIGDVVNINGKSSISIFMNFYGKFVNSGVKGTRSGSSKEGYQFKTENPSLAMLKALSKSQKSASKKIKNTKKKLSGYDKKNLNVSLSNSWGAAVNIKRYGIKATEFLDEAISYVTKKI